jgi:hypothetical protein
MPSLASTRLHDQAPSFSIRIISLGKLGFQHLILPRLEHRIGRRKVGSLFAHFQLLNSDRLAILSRAPIAVR